MYLTDTYTIGNLKLFLWTPGSNPQLDSKFDILREQQFASADKLRENYSREHFSTCEVLSMVEDDCGNVLSCSSILKRPIWPEGVYRILNRLWKPMERVDFTSKVSAANLLLIRSQIQWLKVNRDAKLYFVSREKLNWTKWAVKIFSQQNLHFNTDSRKFLTCEDVNCQACWQTIIYNGDASLLELWKHIKNDN
jgi:hypothetical protein